MYAEFYILNYLNNKLLRLDHWSGPLFNSVDSFIEHLLGPTMSWKYLRYYLLTALCATSWGKQYISSLRPGIACGVPMWYLNKMTTRRQKWWHVPSSRKEHSLCYFAQAVLKPFIECRPCTWAWVGVWKMQSISGRAGVFGKPYG